MARQFCELPSIVVMRPRALEWAAAQKNYIGKDLKEYLARFFSVTPAQRTLKFPKNGQLAFDNYVDWVTAYFTHCGLHAGLDGKSHKNPEEPYRLTACGRELARDSEQGKAVWPHWHQYKQGAGHAGQSQH